MTPHGMIRHLPSLAAACLLAGIAAHPLMSQQETLNNAPAAVETTAARVSAPGIITLANGRVALDIRCAGGHFSGLAFHDGINGRTYRLGRDAFTLSLAEGEKEDGSADGLGTPAPHRLHAGDLTAAEPVIEELAGDPKARRLADRRHGVRVSIPFAWDNDGLSVVWRAELRDGQPYVRLSLRLCGEQHPIPLREVRLLDFKAPNVLTQGRVKGSPATAAEGRLFAGVESPLSVNGNEEGRLVASQRYSLDIPARSPLEVSAVLGASDPGQLRRTFQLSYINEERARPYAPFLNYNTWYDIGYFSRYDEKAALDVVRKYGEELVRKRGAVINSFLMDDGWDDTETLWQFHKGLPNEFRAIRREAESIGAGPGVWFSPWGGYGPPKANRLKAAAGRFETNEKGFSLAGPKYYQHFKDMCLHMIRENGVNHFKFDGTSGEERPMPGSRFSSDFDAIIHLLRELREERSDLFINLTTGTWASPFWFGIADSIWRGGWDHEFLGEGSSRNRWITLRDSRIYIYNVEIAPLFPINSLMTHGVIYTPLARGLDRSEGEDLANEIWSGFGCGTQMQEIYVRPDVLTDAEWDTLAAAAKWARANSETLVDTHWVGGNPVDMEVYGWASWSPKKGILTLRNPSSRAKTYSFEPGAVFELPAGAPAKYRLSSPNGRKLPVGTIEAGRPVTLALAPFEVIVIEAAPLTEEAPRD